MENEIWKDITGFEKLYQISNKGNLKSFHKGLIKILSPGEDKDGYVVIILRKDTVLYPRKMHRLVAIHFIPNPLELKQVNHIDGNKKNNSVENLEWCTPKQNSVHAVSLGLINNKGENNPMAKLSDLQRVEIINKRKAGFTLKEVAEQFGISFKLVSSVTLKAGLDIKLNRYRNFVKHV